MKNNTTSEAQRKAFKNYLSKFDCLRANCPPGTRDRIKALGMSANSFCVTAIMAALEEAERQNK